MGKNAFFHANFLDLTTIENKITGFWECNKMYVSIYSSFKSCIKCFMFQTIKTLPQIIDFIKFCPQISGSKWENIYPCLFWTDLVTKSQKNLHHHPQKGEEEGVETVKIVTLTNFLVKMSMLGTALHAVAKK